MKIGYLAQYSEKEVKFAVKYGFKSIELLVPPGAPLDPVKTDEKTIMQAKENLAKNDIEVSAIGHYPNNLDPDLKKRKENSEYLLMLMDLCRKMDVKVLCTFAGREPDKDIPENIPAFKEFFTPLAKKAEDMGLKIGFENCPMFHWFPFRGVNIAYSPRAWDLMFDAVQSASLGLEYDPSHLVCMLIDYVEIIRRYGSKIVHVHAKDAELIHPAIDTYGILEPGTLRHRIPGYGEVNWAKVVSALVEAGYRGNLDIEGRHDPVFNADLEQAGLVLALKHLQQFVW